MWRQSIAKFSGSILLKHFVKLWTGADIYDFIELMAVAGLAVVETNSVSCWCISLLILLDYPLPSSSSTCTEIQDMNVKLVIN